MNNPPGHLLDRKGDANALDGIRIIGTAMPARLDVDALVVEHAVLLARVLLDRLTVGLLW